MRSFFLVALVLTIASAAALGLLASGSIILSVVRNPLSDFVQPGVTVWWFVLGGPFRAAPTSASGIAFAAVANALLWSFGVWLLAAMYAVIRRRLAALHE